MHVYNTVIVPNSTFMYCSSWLAIGQNYITYEWYCLHTDIFYLNTTTAPNVTDYWWTLHHKTTSYLHPNLHLQYVRFKRDWTGNVILSVERVKLWWKTPVLSQTTEGSEVNCSIVDTIQELLTEVGRYCTWKYYAVNLQETLGVSMKQWRSIQFISGPGHHRKSSLEEILRQHAVIGTLSR